MARAGLTDATRLSSGRLDRLVIFGRCAVSGLTRAALTGALAR
jgi:hypothetical protein